MRLLVAGAVLAGSLLVGGRASAQNADPYFFGDDAALAAGSVVASGRDSGSFWYNPAGFGGLQRGLVNASASTFGLRLRRVPDALKVTVGNRVTGHAMSSADVISVPNAVVAAMQLGDRFAIAAGLLTTQRDLRSGLINVDATLETNLAGEQLGVGSKVDVQTDTSKYHFGGAFAAELTKSLRVGGALYGTYNKTSISLQSGLAYADTVGATGFFLNNARQTQTGFGITASVGAQYDVSRDVTIGVTVRAPEIALTKSSEGEAVFAQSATGGGLTPVSIIQRTDLTGGRPGSPDGILLAPTRVLFGVAYALGPPQSYVEVGGDFTHGLAASEIYPEQRATVNARVGVRYMLSPAWILGGGFFSDRATIRKVGGFATGDQVDWYGLTAGVSKRTPLSLAEHPSPEALVLVTTLSLRSGLGFGTARGVGFNLNDAAAPEPQSDVTFFEIMPYLGSSVLF